MGTTITNLPEPWQLYPMPPEQVAAVERHIERQAAAAVDRDRDRLIALLRDAAAGRREYAVNATENGALILEDDARQLEAVVRLVQGDRPAMPVWRPSWRWTEAMTAGMEDAR